ncbi:GntR family transcriptional regulator [Rhizobium mongolense]|uniref:GntR family transcriptional regulator n=1 Tax=Rhizobium mongolense TaxID=57676 RepID=UPI00355841FF
MSQKQNAIQVAQIVQSVKQDIIFGRLRPRERLIEEDITAQFEASRHVVRAAMNELEQLGLVTRRPNKGVTVRDFTVDEVEQIYEIRAFLQTEAANQIPMPASPQLISALEAIHAEYCAAHDKGELQRVCSLNNQFHRTIWEACKNQYLATLIDRVWTETIGIRCYGIGDPALLALARREHGEMIEMLRSGDREGFLRLTVEHMKPSLEAYKRAHGGWANRTTGQADSRVRVPA